MTSQRAAGTQLQLHFRTLDLRLRQIEELGTVHADVEHLLILPDVVEHGGIQLQRVVRERRLEAELERVEVSGSSGRCGNGVSSVCRNSRSNLPDLKPRE